MAKYRFCHTATYPPTSRLSIGFVQLLSIGNPSFSSPGKRCSTPETWCAEPWSCWMTRRTKSCPRANSGYSWRTPWPSWSSLWRPSVVNSRNNAKKLGIKLARFMLTRKLRKAMFAVTNNIWFVTPSMQSRYVDLLSLLAIIKYGWLNCKNWNDLAYRFDGIRTIPSAFSSIIVILYCNVYCNILLL